MHTGGERMLGEQSQLIALFALALGVQAALLYSIFRRVPNERDRDVGEALERTASGQAERSTVECPSCGAVNEAGYRYCRSCLEELPGGTIVQQERRNPMVPGGSG